jgi:Flp pilus assembly protein TadD
VAAQPAPASELSAVQWQLAYERALALIERARIGPAIDLLRALVLARPQAAEAWNALADCHERADDTVTAHALRLLGRTLATFDP